MTTARFLCMVAALLVLAPGGLAQTAPKSKFRKSRLTRDESEARADHRTLLLTRGEDKTVDLDFDVAAGVGGIQTGAENVVKPVLVRSGEKRQLIFKPLEKGSTTVTIREEDGTVRLIFHVKVTDSNLMRQASEIRGLLKDIEGIDIRVVGQKIVIDGEVLVPADYGRLMAVISDPVYDPIVLNLTTLSPMAMTVLAKRIQEDISPFAPNVHTRVVNGMIFLEGTVDKLEDAKRAREVAKLYLPETRPGNQLAVKDKTAQPPLARELVQSFIIVNPPPPKKAEKLVRVTVHFVELSKDYNKLFGFNWTPTFTSDPSISVGTNGAGGAGASGTSFSGIIGSLFPKLESAQSAGYARVLKTGTVIVRSGQKAEIREEIQYPVTVTQTNGATTSTTFNAGFGIGMTPQILGQSEDIQLGLDMEVSNAVGRTVAGTAPVIAKRKVVTNLYVRNSESAAVGGIVSSDIGTDFNKDAPGGDTGTSPSGTTSPLFRMVRSKNYRKQKSQFVIFLTPQIVDSAAEGSEDLKKNFRIKVK